MFGTFVVAAMVAVMFTLAGASDSRADVIRGRARARLLAEGTLSAVESDLRETIANFDNPLLSGTRTIAGVEVNFEVTELGLAQVASDPGGLSRTVQPYEIVATANEDGVAFTSRTLINVERLPLFQFAAFYDGTLEIHPGPSMTLRGRVHSNQDIHLGGGNRLTLDTNYTRAVGDIFRNRRFSDRSTGQVDIRRYVDNPFDPAAPAVFERMLGRNEFTATTTVSGYDSNFTEGFDTNGDGDLNDPSDWLPFEFGALELWGPPEGSAEQGHTVLTGQHGITEAVAPGIESIQLYDETPSGTGGDYRFDAALGDFVLDPGNGTHERGHFFDNAGLAIVVDTVGNFQVLDGAGNDISFAVQVAISLDGVPDFRQSDSMAVDTRVIRIDIDELNESGHFPSNGLIYGGRVDIGEGTDAGGILLTGGTEISSALTVASNGAVYVQGDYNTIDKKPASIISDTVNLLSNAWDGTKAPGELPDAVETTYNVAMVTGSSESTPDAYNGGFENLPRFHEDWQDVDCNIAGSFVNIYDSQAATGDWVFGRDRYTAPNRNWDYEQLFNDINNLPPFTPVAISVSRIVTF